MQKFFLILGCGFFLGGVAFGQSVSWTDPGQIPPQSGVQLDLVFTDCQPKGNVNLPSVAGLQFSASPSRATSLSIINFQTSSSTTLSYTVQASQSGRVQISSFEVVTDKGRMTVPSLALDVTAAAANRARQANPFSPNFPFPPNPFQNQAPDPGSQVVPPDAVKASAEAEPRRPFVGEVFDVNYRVVMTGNRSGRVKTTPLWDVQNFTAEAWDRGQQIGPGGSQGLQFHTKAMVPKAGLFELPSIRQKLDIDTAAGGRSFFFTAPGSVEVEAVAAPVPLNVEALPANAPAGFKGAVGQFVLESKLVPEQVNEGEPVTWTLTLRGTGNWPMGVELPARVVPKEIRTIQPKLRREFSGTEIFTGAIVEDLVMIPTKSGEFDLPAVKFAYFDPKKKSYETIEAKPPKVVVSKQAGGLALPASPVIPATSTSAPAKKAGQASSAKVAQSLAYGEPALPREPLEGSGFGVAPVGQGWWLGLGILPCGVLLGIWWRWAAERSAVTDRFKEQKEALQRWKSAVELIERANSKDQIVKPLILWQQAVAKTLGLSIAVPSAESVRKTKAKCLKDPDVAAVASCYQTVEDALYGKETGVKIQDWCEEATKLANKVAFRQVTAFDALRPRNLFPWITALLFLLVAVEPVGAQEDTKEQSKKEKTSKEDPIQLYKTGNFSEAEKVWRERVALSPRDPVAKNNLALAYFQLGDKERALAYGLSAYLISPSTPSVSWNTRIFAQSADQLDRAVLGLWNDWSREWLTARLGVFGWQVVLVLGLAILMAGCGFGLGSGYFPQKKTLLVRIGGATLMSGLLLFLGAATALAIYGKLADRKAVMIVDVEPLRSIPTEAEAQAEKAYPPGSIARLEKSFLGWSKIRLPNQDSGWIRTEHLVPLY